MAAVRLTSTPPRSSSPAPSGTSRCTTRGVILRWPCRQPCQPDRVFEQGVQQNRILLVIETVMWDARPCRSGPGPLNILKGVGRAGRRPRCRTDSQESKGEWDDKGGTSGCRCRTGQGLYRQSCLACTRWAAARGTRSLGSYEVISGVSMGGDWAWRRIRARGEIHRFCWCRAIQDCCRGEFVRVREAGSPGETPRTGVAEPMKAVPVNTRTGWLPPYWATHERPHFEYLVATTDGDFTGGWAWSKEAKGVTGITGNQTPWRFWR